MIKADHRPLYVQVIEKLKQEMEDKQYQPGEKLPSEFELAKWLGVSRATLREALRMMEEEGVLRRRHGVGTFVKSRPLFTAGIEELHSVTDMIIRAKKQPGTVFLSSTIEAANEEDDRLFQIDSLQEVTTLERVRTADQEPVVYCLDKLPFPFMIKQSLHETTSIFDMLEEQAGRTITHAVTSIEPVGYHEKISPILECEPETSLLVLKQMHYDKDDNPILYSLDYFRADKFEFHVVRRRL